MPSLDDTQPKAPVQLAPDAAPDNAYRGDPRYADSSHRDPRYARPDSPYQDDDETGGPGCFFWGLVSVFALGLALAIVLLAGAAGWTEGQNQGDRFDASVERVQIGEQLTRIPGELAANQLELVGIRLNYLETVVPDSGNLSEIRATVTSMAGQNATATLASAVDPVLTQIPASIDAVDTNALRNSLAYIAALLPDYQTLPELQVTATALAINAQPTPTPPSLETPEATEDALIVEATVEAPLPTANASGFDLTGLLDEAETELALGDYQAAFDTLDAITRIDPNYERATVRGLLQQTLNTWALNLYRTTDEEDLAEAIRVTNLTEDLGFPIDELDYERLLAGLYLDARRAIALDDHIRAINAINQIRTYQGEYKGVNLNNLLFNEYVDYGRAFEIGSEPCRAVAEYTRALNIRNDAGLVAQRDAAQTACQNQQLGTPGPGTPAAPGLGGTPITP